MSEFYIRTLVDGKELSKKDVQEIEMSRIQHVFTDLTNLGGELVDKDGVKISLSSAQALDFSSAKKALIQTKIALGSERLLSLYENELKKSDVMWREIASKSEIGKNTRDSFIEFEVEGVTLGDFIASLPYISSRSDRNLPYHIHPEHFVNIDKKDGQMVMETLGMYGGPTYLFIKVHGKKPFPKDPDTNLSLVAGNATLISDNMDIQMRGMHQFKAKKNGMKIKLAIIFPEAAPREIAEGHKYHLAVEFYNMIAFAGETKSFGGKVINSIVKHLKI